MYYSENMKPIASNYDNSKDLLQSQIGKLLLMSGQTKLDITFDIYQPGTNFKYSDDKDIKYDNNIIAHLNKNYSKLSTTNWERNVI